MDPHPHPPTLASFPNHNNNNNNHNQSEIWHQFPINGGTNVDESEFGLGLRIAHFVTGNLAHCMKPPDEDPDSPKNACNGKRLKREEDKEKEKEKESNSQPSIDQPKQDYIHVRARRGQATDSHSLAERARREKIGERMKILQDLVPGCNKVIGKALVLDEIINYIQSLQHQVEFLSMKLEAVNSRSPGIEMFPSKDYGEQTFDTNGVAFGSQPRREYSRASSPEWLHMQIGGSFERSS